MKYLKKFEQYYNKTLNPKFWTDDMFNERIREKLLTIADDFYNNLDYDAITSINTSSIQEIDRQQQSDKARIFELETKVAEQQSLINNIIDRLNKIGA